MLAFIVSCCNVFYIFIIIHQKAGSSEVQTSSIKNKRTNNQTEKKNRTRCREHTQCYKLAQVITLFRTNIYSSIYETVVSAREINYYVEVTLKLFPPSFHALK